jgi:hypothetical protein
MASSVRSNGRPRATVNGEPMCASGNPDPNQNDTNDDHWWAFGCISQILKIGAIFHSQELLGSDVNNAAHAAQLQAFIEGRARVSSRLPGNEFWANTSGVLGGDSPYTVGPSLPGIYGRHNGITGVAFAMFIPGGWTEVTGLATGWTAVAIETRGDGMLIQLERANTTFSDGSYATTAQNFVIELGGSKHVALNDPAAGAGTYDVVDAPPEIDFPAPPADIETTIKIVVHCRTRGAGTSITPVLRDLTAASDAWTGDACVATNADYSGANQEQEAEIALITGHKYRLRGTVALVSGSMEATFLMGRIKVGL